MAEDTTTGSTSDAASNVQLMLDERDMRATFSNAYRIHTTAEEVVLDFGFNMLNPNPQTGQQQMLFKVSDRMIMTYSTVKRLTGSLTQLIRRYEQQFGEIPMQPGQIGAGGAAPPPPRNR
ncbi:MAG TPA: DUF3467 domain-containing protein [Tepidisphaeraceae bacterium]|jgi:hypothetical protein|nr:DUF3467 domain-containing protein [Tepidisphaeraceae bacterium]